MEALINIKEQNGNQAVSARELYDFLGYTPSQWKRWYTKNIISDSFFDDGVDYVTFDIVSNGNHTKDFALTLDMAKELSMLAKTEKGKQARTYFIECEKKLKSNQRELSRKELALMVIEQEEKLELLQKQNSKLQPRSDYFELVIKSDDLLSMSQTAKILGLPFGRNKLLRKLREMGILFKSTNEPKQDLVEKGYFKIKENMKARSDGSPIVFLQTFITQKGLAFLVKKLEIIQVPEIKKTIFLD